MGHGRRSGLLVKWERRSRVVSRVGDDVAGTMRIIVPAVVTVLVLAYVLTSGCLPNN